MIVDDRKSHTNHTGDNDETEGTPNSSFPKGLFQQILQSMNPSVCFSPGSAGARSARGTASGGSTSGGGTMTNCTNPFVEETDIVDYDSVVPPLLRDLKSQGKSRTMALQRLFKLTEKENQQHRVPVVCSKKFDTMNALVPCLSPDASHTDRRQALLLLNNLCIPQDNKKQILLGERRDVMLHSLLLILQRRLPEVHIAAASLYNLSFLEETKLMLLQYTPPPSLMMGEEGSAISKSQSSLLRIVEDMVVDFTPCLSLGTRKTTSTVEAASVRWCMALMRNLVTERDNATIVAAKTKFPVLAAQILLESDGDLSHWKRDSVEDSSLLLLLLLVRTGGDEACRAMDCGELRAACHAVSQYPGIHGVRAGVIAQRLEEVQPSNIADEHKTDDPVEAARELYYRRPRNDEVDRKRDLNGLRSLDDEEYDRATMASF